MKPTDLFEALPEMLRNELVNEFDELTSNFSQSRWRASGLNAGRFCEIVYCVLKGHAAGEYPEKTEKPSDFPGACRQLETLTTLPRSFRFIIPRILSSLYEVRNQRNIGHVGGAVDPSFMDASFVAANAKWILAELIRHFHSVSEKVAQSTVDSISQYSSPVVWSDTEVRRVLATGLTLDEKILLLLSSAGGRANRDSLFQWLDHKTRSTFNKRIADLHARRLIEAKAYGRDIQLLPPGAASVAQIGSASEAMAA